MNSGIAVHSSEHKHGKPNVNRKIALFCASALRIEYVKGKFRRFLWFITPKDFTFFLALYNRCSTLSFVFELVESRLMTEDRTESEARLPGLMGEYTDEELNQHVIKHAKYFTVVQINRGGFVGGGKNYDRHQVPDLAEARKKAAELYAADPGKRGILIYAVAVFAGANGFSRPVENYPKSTWESKSQKAEREKKERKAGRERAREARLNLGAKHFAPKPEPLKTTAEAPAGWFDADVALVLVTDEDDED